MSGLNPMREFIAVVDDEPDIVDLITLHLRKAGYRAEGYPGGRRFLDSLEKLLPDLVLLDLMLPDVEGLEVFRLLRSKPEWASVPVIMVTAKGDESDKVVGLELGADDYVTKPFSPKELVARVRAVLRRKSASGESRKIDIPGVLSIDLDRHEVRVTGRTVELTSAEFNILTLLVSKRGWVFTRDQILDHLWGQEKIVLDRTVDVHIRNLREKLGPEAASRIKNVRGVGYKLEP
jgi:two-component system phosphate regulon response regulator PhoB/two-component system alkaline phosphatase synthesis response regulator PhoP